MQTRLKRFRILSYYYLFLIALIVGASILVPIRWTVVESGLIEPAKREFIKPEVEGIISAILVRDGDTVSKGQVLAKMNDPLIAVKTAADQAEFEKAKMHFDYVKRMRKKGYMSASDLRDAEIGYQLQLTKINQSKNLDIIAPIDGTLLTTDEFNLRTGDKIDPGTIIATVADLSEMRMKVRVHEHNISKVQVGNEVRVYVNAFTSMLYSTISGKVTRLIPQAQSDNTGTYFVVIIALDKNSLTRGGRQFKLVPGMAGSAKIVYDKSSFFNHVIKQGFDTFSHSGR